MGIKCWQLQVGPSQRFMEQQESYTSWTLKNWNLMINKNMNINVFKIFQCVDILGLGFLFTKDDNCNMINCWSFFLSYKLLYFIHSKILAKYNLYLSTIKCRKWLLTLKSELQYRSILLCWKLESSQIHKHNNYISASENWSFSI